MKGKGNGRNLSIAFRYLSPTFQVPFRLQIWCKQLKANKLSEPFRFWPEKEI